jgi:hypothetical protein
MTLVNVRRHVTAQNSELLLVSQIRSFVSLCQGCCMFLKIQWRVRAVETLSHLCIAPHIATYLLLPYMPLHSAPFIWPASDFGEEQVQNVIKHFYTAFDLWPSIRRWIE